MENGPNGVSIQLVVATMVALLLLLERQVLAAGSSSFNGSISFHSLTMDTKHANIMQVVRQHHPHRFSYCLRREPGVQGQPLGLLRFDNEVLSTSGMHHTALLYNADHRADYGPYHVDLAGVSVDRTALEGVDAGTFRRDAATGKGGTVIDPGTRPGVVMVRAAYDALERAVERRLRPFGLPRVSHPPFL